MLAYFSHLLDNSILDTTTGAIVVDLSQPEVAIAVEMLLVARKQSCLGVCFLPASMCEVKPLLIKVLKRLQWESKRQEVEQCVGRESFTYVTKDEHFS